MSPDDLLTCARCTTPYRPALTVGDCPVCGLVGDPGQHLAGMDEGTRPVVLAVAAMAANLLVFALIVWAVVG